MRTIKSLFFFTLLFWSSADAREHFASGFSVACATDQWCHLQLWNPNDSGKIFLVKMVRVSGEGSVLGTAILSSRGPLHGLFRNGINTSIMYDNSARGEIRYLASRSEFVGGILEANQVPLESWITYTVHPGWGILVRASDRGGILKATFFWEEQPFAPPTAP